MVENIQTQPKSPGSNPTLNTSIHLNIPLPTDPLYCPKLSCNVYDYILTGLLTQPLIGTFDLPIGELMIEKIKSQKDEVEDMQKLLDKLDNLIKSDVNQTIKAFD